MKVANVLLDSSLTYALIGSVVLTLLLLVLRHAASRVILRHVSQLDVRLKWLVATRNVLLLVLMGGLAAIWAQELRTFAVSMVAIAAAFVIATKELIACISGYVLRATSKAYAIGDRIEVGEFRGDVVDHNLLTTTILEIGPGRSFHMHTGRTIVIPNSKLFERPVINESSMEQFVVHLFTIPLRVEDDWKRAEQILLNAALGECEGFLTDARQHMEYLETQHGISTPSVEPHVSVQLPEPGRVQMLVRVPAPIGRQGRLEQTILRRFLQEFYRASEATAG